MKYLCPRGCGEISRDKKAVSKGYFGACLTCDEDFYKFELNILSNKEYDLLDKMK